MQLVVNFDGQFLLGDVMSVQRIVVVADDLDLAVLSRALVSVGVQPKNIHISEDAITPELRELGVCHDLPPGPLKLRSEKDGEMSTHYFSPSMVP